MIDSEIAHNLDYLPQATLQKALSYLAEARISIKEVELCKLGYDNEVDYVIYAIVRSNYSDFYKVCVCVDREDLTPISLNCSCPVQDDCKHAVATYIEFVSNFEKYTGKNNNASIIDKLYARDETKINLIHPFFSFNKALQSLKKSATKNSNFTNQENNTPQNEVVFCLDYIDRIKKPCVSVYRCKQLKKGGYGKPSQVKTLNYATCSTLHLDVISLIYHTNESADYANRTYRDYECYLIGNIGETLLNKVIATERFYLLDLNFKPYLTPIKIAKPLAVKFEWIVNEYGEQKLTLNIPETAVLFQLDSIWYLDYVSAQLGKLETDLSIDKLMMIHSMPFVPPDQVNIANKNIKTYTGIKPPKPQQPELLPNIKPTPVPVMEIDSFYIGNQKYLEYAKRNKAWITAELYFKYGDIMVNPAIPETFVYSYNNNKLQKIECNLSKQQQMLKSLESLKLQADLLEHKTEEPPTLNILLCHEIDSQGWEQVLNNTIPKLREQGWQINIADYLLPEVELDAEQWYSQLDNSTDRGWLEFELGAVVNGEKINLLPILIRSISMAELTEAGSKDKPDMARLKLAENKFLNIPKELLQQFINIVATIGYSAGTNNHQTLKISEYQLSLLNELKLAEAAQAIHKIYPDKINRVLEKLNSYAELSPKQATNNFVAELRPYQQLGLAWLEFITDIGFAGILADDMGLGKTVQALAFIDKAISENKIDKPVLIIAPTSVMFNWYAEALKFTPHLKAMMHYGPDRKLDDNTIKQYNIIITSYNVALIDKSILLQYQYALVILDEAQNIKNANAKITHTVNQLQADSRICLTGTPIENNLGELWSIFNFLMPGFLGNKNFFTKQFRTPIEKHKDFDKQKLLNRITSPFILRRDKKNVLLDLPDKSEIIDYIELSESQRNLYELTLLAMNKKVNEAIQAKGIERSQILILDALLKLRQICCDPRLLKTSETDKYTVQDSAKLVFLIEKITQLLAAGKKILLFSQFTSMLALIEEQLQKQSIAYAKLTGSTTKRDKVVELFQSGKVNLFLISLKAGGTGLNLTAADTVIHYDPWWNPAAEMQATDRAYRIGQVNKVFVYKLITKNTIEEKIIKLQQEKQDLIQSIFADNKSATKLSSNDILTLFDRN